MKEQHAKLLEPLEEQKKAITRVRGGIIFFILLKRNLFVVVNN